MHSRGGVWQLPVASSGFATRASPASPPHLRGSSLCPGVASPPCQLAASSHHQLERRLTTGLRHLHTSIERRLRTSWERRLHAIMMEVEGRLHLKTTVKPKILFESWGDDSEDNENGATEPPPSASELGEFASGAVSADGQPCAQIATNVLRKNGSAADATIAGLFCVGVVNTQSMGLGGGFFLTYYERSSGKAYTLNARETAPGAAFEDMYHGNEDLMEKGGMAVAVPGELRGYRELYTRFGGQIPWSDLLEPTIKLCEEGHTVNWHMARALRFNRESILSEPSMSVFINPDSGDVYKEKEVLKRPQLAKTLRVIQDYPDALYSGQLADKLADDIQELGGIITSEDLRNYKPEWREAMNVSLQNGNMRMFSILPPGSGLILGFILNILDEYGMTTESMNEGQKILTHHRITEAMKWAYAKRTELGDSNYVNITEFARNLTSDAFAKSVQSQIMDDQTFQDPGHYGAITTTKEDHGTAHLSLLAPNGDAVAVTSTINLYFGAGIRSKQTGIVLNDEMDDFSAPNITSYFGLPPSPANFIRPGKRPLSSMCPAVFIDSEGDVRLVIGAAGGTKISSGVAWVSLNNLWLGDNIKEAIDARRIHHQLFPMTLDYETGTATITDNRLKGRAGDVGGKGDVVSETIYCEEFFKCSCNQVLIKVTDDDGVVAGVLLQ
ncbi:Glutathione hydrolase 1 proenzyme [Chionoecetes opilio]|uniref:Glutathione hydrolase 1 proenzyme n=1 Tax=Chionoecetes opilio TaxID=41210 RepID=A0A8J4Y3B9_CHIOP|nr:Glutathione hydrolase 1 proenzyme [Chionoecetes opilio]